jgi:hypothetical protein
VDEALVAEGGLVLHLAEDVAVVDVEAVPGDLDEPDEAAGVDEDLADLEQVAGEGFPAVAAGAVDAVLGADVEGAVGGFVDIVDDAFGVAGLVVVADVRPD